VEIDRSKVNLVNAKELLRLSELYLDGTVRLSLAADSRAMSLTGMLATASTTLIAAGLALLFTKTDLSRVNFVLGIASLGASLVLIRGTWLAISSAKPKRFSIGGNYMASWNEGDFYGDLKHPIMDQIEIYQEKINTNLAKLESGSSYIHGALRSVFMAPIVALILGGAAYIGFPYATFFFK